MKSFLPLLAFVFIPLAALGAPVDAAKPQLPSVFSVLASSVSTTERLAISSAAAALQAQYNALQSATSVDLTPTAITTTDDTEGQTRSGIDGELGSADDSANCFEAAGYQATLESLFAVLTDSIGFGKREARTLLRALLGLPYDAPLVSLDSPAMKCFLEDDYTQISDLLVTLSRIPPNEKFLVPTPSPDEGTSRVALDIAARQVITNALDVYLRVVREAKPEIVKAVEKAKSALKAIARPIQEKNNCPFFYKTCCMFYNIPGVNAPEQKYFDCCFNALYPYINYDWDTYYANLYADLSSAEYTLLYCYLPSVD